MSSWERGDRLVRYMRKPNSCVATRPVMKIWILPVILAGSCVFTSCIFLPGFGSSSSHPKTYTIGGTVINLAGTGGGLLLQDNGADPFLVNANGTFTFPTALASGAAYSVTVSLQPSTPAQTCGVTQGTGTATANVTSVVVDCGHKEWTWVGGSNVLGQSGTYGTEGTASAGNVPGARSCSFTWMDATGNFWLLGGVGNGSPGSEGAFNDLWKYSGGEWTWVSGSGLADESGSYGILGTAAAGNVPGARFEGVSWTDASGNLWLFGGVGFDSKGTQGQLNDLWKYGGGQWTWMGGSDLAGQKGTYGILGTAAASNVPGARFQPVSWTDRAGNFWLFGGQGFDSAGTFSYLNDLWKYSGNQWTWMGGSNLVNQRGTYGIQGSAGVSNVPGARYAGMAWTDTAGNFWLFGGGAFDSAGNVGYLNDLWEYSGGQWTWMGGSNVVNEKGLYGSQGIAAAANIPGARDNAVAWTDRAGNLWLFGGDGYDSAGSLGALNDLWEYSSGQWAWMGGSNVISQRATYGTEGTVAPGNIPGARFLPVGWGDSAGDLWLFGGYGFVSTGTANYLNDLWKYEP